MTVVPWRRCVSLNDVGLPSRCHERGSRLGRHQSVARRAADPTTARHPAICLATASVAVDGICGTQMYRAIAEVQHRVVGHPRPDRRIDPDGPTLRVLNAIRSVMSHAPQLTSPLLPHAVVSFPQRPEAQPVTARRTGRELPAELINAARQSERRWDSPPRSALPADIGKR